MRAHCEATPARVIGPGSLCLYRHLRFRLETVASRHYANPTQVPGVPVAEHRYMCVVLVDPAKLKNQSFSSPVKNGKFPAVGVLLAG
jgi:hypothetical protein